MWCGRPPFPDACGRLYCEGWCSTPCTHDFIKEFPSKCSVKCWYMRQRVGHRRQWSMLPLLPATQALLSVYCRGNVSSVGKLLGMPIALMKTRTGLLQPEHCIWAHCKGFVWSKVLVLNNFWSTLLQVDNQSSETNLVTAQLDKLFVRISWVLDDAFLLQSLEILPVFF